jgi:TonB family protein
LGSGIAHLLLLVGVFLVRGPIASIVPGPEVVQVALIDAAAAATPPPPAVQAPPEPKPEEIKPVEEKGVKLKPQKPEKKVKEPRREERPAEAPAALPSARIGPTGLRGDLAVDAATFEFTYYLVLVRNKIASNWAPPAGLAAGGKTVRAVVYFRIGRDGELAGARLETGSGADFFDRAALRAVVISDPMPPLPFGYAGGELGVHFGFEWESP